MGFSYPCTGPASANLGYLQTFLQYEIIAPCLKSYLAADGFIFHETQCNLILIIETFRK